MESNDSPEIPDRGETSDIPGLPSGEERERERRKMQDARHLLNKPFMFISRGILDYTK